MKKFASASFVSSATMRDFFSFYQRLAEQKEPLIRIDNFLGMGEGWATYRYDDAVEILKDPRFVKINPIRDIQNPTKPQKTGNRFADWLNSMPNMLVVDPPDHTRLRRLVAKAFTPQMIENMRPHIQQIADELIDAVQDRGEMDLIADFAYPLPIIVISEMLGVPSSDRNLFRNWTTKIQKLAMDPDKVEELNAVFEEFIQYSKTLIAEKRKNPGNDVTSGLIQSHDNEDKLSENELISTFFLLISAGHETTVNLIANGTLALLQHPNQLRLLQDDPSLISTTVEELLRYVGPATMTIRYAREDITMHSENIHKGDMLLISLTAANIDPHMFTNPEELDITREEKDHLAFGKGIHYCLGAPLARMEGQIAFSTLFQRLPKLSLATQPEKLIYKPGTMLSLESLPVSF
jgi:cytochrome P450 PksS